MLFLPKAETLLHTPKFLVKSIIFLILVINGGILHQFILPRLVQFSFHKNVWLIKNILSIRHAGFITGAISIVSWYSVFLLGTFKHFPWSFFQIFGVYLLIILVAITISLLIEKKITAMAKK